MEPNEEESSSRKRLKQEQQEQEQEQEQQQESDHEEEDLLTSRNDLDALLEPSAEMDPPDIELPNLPNIGTGNPVPTSPGLPLFQVLTSEQHEQQQQQQHEQQQEEEEAQLTFVTPGQVTHTDPSCCLVLVGDGIATAAEPDYERGQTELEWVRSEGLDELCASGCSGELVMEDSALEGSSPLKNRFLQLLGIRLKPGQSVSEHLPLLPIFCCPGLRSLMVVAGLGF